ncbi:MAG: helix-turn-helix domain-containing protein [Candidatus Nanoarchaeia archaeon]|nr:helix-turn-helix domain-containing protein [Candidatus Nanoarchaeia archaeon]MDD5239240.1 helix-turn-helix domain-containing protein [Candidatus Nanoarchaeia archaeon]
MASKPASVVILETLSKKWTLRLLDSLNNAPKKRFNQLVDELTGISPKTLSERLLELTKYRVLDKKYFAERPPRVEYSLTPKGKELVMCFRHIDSFSKRW